MPLHRSSFLIEDISPDSSFIMRMQFSVSTDSIMPAPAADHLSPTTVSMRLYLNSGTSRNSSTARFRSLVFPSTAKSPETDPPDLLNFLSRASCNPDTSEMGCVCFEGVIFSRSCLPDNFMDASTSGTSAMNSNSSKLSNCFSAEARSLILTSAIFYNNSL